MSKCKGCGGEFRAGKRVLLLGRAREDTRTAIVCSACVKRGTTIVAPLLAPVVRQVEQRSEEVTQAIRQLAAYAKAATAAGETPFTRGRAEGLESAIELLRAIGQGR